MPDKATPKSRRLPRNEQERQAWNLGDLTAAKALGLEHNPYDGRTRMGRVWKWGWQHRVEEFERAQPE